MTGKKVSAILMTIISAAFTWVVMNVNVGIAGKTQTQVGLVTMNEWFNNKLGGVNELCYEVSKYAGYASFIVVGAFALVGLVQLIKRRSLFKVDREIICMGFLYIVTLGLYVAFMKYAITYRPAYAPGEVALESSFPSSHSMLAIVVGISAMMIVGKYISNKGLLILVRVLLVLLWMITLGSRVLSGVHWLSDIIAGILYALTLVLWYNLAISVRGDKKSSLGYQGKHYKKS